MRSGYPLRYAAVALLLCTLVLGGCFSLPTLEGRRQSSALPVEQAEATALGRAVQARLALHSSVSGIHALKDPREAFAARALLARAAQRTLDVQYYIWQDDLTGTLLLEALRDAAERGVRVRLLLDDNGTSGLDDTLAALDAHGNIEIRLFNPFMLRSPKWLGYITDFSRLNRRMHNKSFTADNQATIVGGRNIGDEYFGATDGTLFADLDVLAIGPVVQAVSRDFDRYWASDSSYPVDRLLPAATPQALEALDNRAERIDTGSAANAYMEALAHMELVERLLAGEVPLNWAATRMLSDDPAKGLGEVDDEARLIDRLAPILGSSAQTLDLVSPYFVPAEVGTQALVSLAEEGVDIRVLTNSLAATDVAVVHAGYAKRRKALLEAGIKLYEMRRLSSSADFSDRLGPFGSSGSSLHAKTFASDGDRLFVGSFNFDPRSANLNTELGFVIESPEMAQAVHAAFREDVPVLAYRVRLSESGELYWVGRENGDRRRYDTEPHTAWWQRLAVRFFSLLPIDWLL